MFYSIFRWVSITSNYNSTAFYLKQLLSFITCFKSNKLFAFIPPWLLPQVFILGLPLVFQFPINLCGLSLTPYVPSTLTHDQVLRRSCQHSPWDNHNQLNSLKINMIQLWAERHNPGRLNSTGVLGARRSPVGHIFAFGFGAFQVRKGGCHHELWALTEIWAHGSEGNISTVHLKTGILGGKAILWFTEFIEK